MKNMTIMLGIWIWIVYQESRILPYSFFYLKIGGKKYEFNKNRRIKKVQNNKGNNK